MKKITKATFKSFVRRNRDNLLISNKSDYSAMDDCVMPCSGKFRVAEKSDRDADCSLGINGIWLVNGSRDWFTAFETEEMIGIEVSNCCGSFTVAIRKEA